MGFGMFFAAAVLTAALFWLVVARKSRLQYASGSADKRAGHARVAKIAALLLTGLGVGFFLIFAVGELAGGEISGIQHLPPAALLGALLWLGWKRPRTAGIVVLLAHALPLTDAIDVGIATEDTRTGEMWLAALIPLVPVLTALLFLRAGRRRGGQS
jgi:hypothetical protein